MNELKYKWETDQDSFEVLSREHFDALHGGEKFSSGPLVAKPSEWASEFGPYNPYRWAFGQLTDGRLVCCDTAKGQEQLRDFGRMMNEAAEAEE